MATSGSVDLSTTRNQIIIEALELMGAYEAEQTPENTDIESCARTLNFMIKAWQAEEIGLWKNQTITLFQDLNGISYNIGPTGDHVTASAVKTEIATAAESGANSIVVDSIDDISDADNIGIELDDRTLQWTTVNGDPSGSTIALDNSLTDTAAVNKFVYAYTTKANRPLEIIECRVRYPGDTEVPIWVVARTEYTELANKTTTGIANQVYYDPQTVNGVLKVWPAANNVQYRLIMTARMPIEDFDTISNEPDFPQEWFLALSYNLAVLAGPKFVDELPPLVIQNALTYKEAVSNFDEEHNSVYFGVRRFR